MFIDMDNPPRPRNELTLAQLELFAHEIGIHSALILSTNPPESPDIDRLQQENAELRARLAALEDECSESNPKARNNHYRIIAALMNLPRIIPEAEYTTIHRNINTELERLGAKRIQKPDTVADVIKAARALIEKDKDSTGSEIGLD